MSEYKKYNDGFINYAHRGASAYLPDSTFLSFYTGIYMGANGIETDVHETKDGVLILYHDHTMNANLEGDNRYVWDVEYIEFIGCPMTRGNYYDRVVTLEDFLKHFCSFDMTFAIELKAPCIEKKVANLLRKYYMKEKVVVTSFNIEYLENFRKIAPEFEIGYLSKQNSYGDMMRVKELGGEEICPFAPTLTKEAVDAFHQNGLRVRAWGVKDEEIMKRVYDYGVDGMTVNFPDKLTEYIKSKQA